MYNALQSADKRFHSTETALLKVRNDVTLNMDKGKVAPFTLLDLSAAFNTIDHNVLIKRLLIWYGISGAAKSWFSSYLIDKYKRVKIANCFSAALPSSCSAGFCSWTSTFYSLHYSTQLSYSNPYLGPPPVCR